ncbi:hypothetical protein ACFQY5_02775 [Paeniroseomonas aquatica]|uniref:Uncharacterized protein n=1 Tax=Paeniroseomonas aquatica TaxID=373043 RepID=A0ABT8A6B4_9PROT|nr:hypothetical protein [Paeniroseomonas aquatica]
MTCCPPPPRRCGAGPGDPAMNELLTILPWAFCLVAAAAAVKLSR